jgi:hypothetical protein
MGRAKRYPTIEITEMMGFAKSSTHPKSYAIVLISKLWRSHIFYIVEVTGNAFQKVVQVCHYFPEIGQVNLRQRQLHGTPLSVVRKSKRVGARINGSEFRNQRFRSAKRLLVGRLEIAFIECNNAYKF